jgi:glycosyltransferase involved in cell wall biosynthesis
MKISIVIPAYNEEKRIGPTLDAYTHYFDMLVKKKELDYEIIVSLNNTTDRTEEIVKQKQKKNKRLKYINLVPGGKGFAIIEGFKEALKRDNDLIGFVDADMATPPQAYHYLISQIGDFDGIIASRYIKGSLVKPKPTFARIFVSRIFNAFIRAVLLMPYRDTQCGAKLFKRRAVESAIPRLTLSQWDFDVDLIYTLRRGGFKIKEVPTIWSDKKYSKLNFMSVGPFMALGIIRMRLLNSPFKMFIRVYDKLISMLK